MAESTVSVDSNSEFNAVSRFLSACVIGNDEYVEMVLADPKRKWGMS